MVNKVNNKKVFLGENYYTPVEKKDVTLKPWEIKKLSQESKKREVSMSENEVALLNRRGCSYNKIKQIIISQQRKKAY